MCNKRRINNKIFRNKFEVTNNTFKSRYLRNICLGENITAIKNKIKKLYKERKIYGNLY